MSVSVGTNEQRIKAFYLSNKKKQGLKYLNTKRIKTHRRPCCADLCMCVDLPLDKKLWKIRTGPPGRRATGPWRAAGRRAAGPRRAVGYIFREFMRTLSEHCGQLPKYQIFKILILH